MRGWAACALILVACAADEEETPPCSACVAEAAARFQEAVLAMRGRVVQQEVDIAGACARIAIDLGAEPPPDAAPSCEAVSDACQAAADALAATGAMITVDASGGGCDTDDDARAECARSCSSAAEGLCLVTVGAHESCTPPTVTVTSTDPAIVATLEENLPIVEGALQQLEHAGGGAELGGIVVAFTEELLAAGGCAVIKTAVFAQLDDLAAAPSDLACVANAAAKLPTAPPL
jgi:hypothetical protein